MPIRERTDQAIVPGGNLLWVNDHANIAWGTTPAQSEQVVTWIGPTNVTSLHEYMEDEHTGGTRFGRCLHLKNTFDFMSGDLQHADFDSPLEYLRSYRYEGSSNISQLVDFATTGQPAGEPKDMFHFLAGSMPAWDDYNWDAFTTRAYNAMEPSLEGRFSVLNFLWELRDFKTLHKLVLGKHGLRHGMSPLEYIKNIFVKPSRAIDGLRSVGKQVVAPYKKRGWKGVIDAISHGHLSWEFAIKPLVSDLQQISNILSTMNSRIDEFRNRAGIPQLRHYVEREDAPDFADQEIYLGAQHGGRVVRTGSPQIERHATMSYTYSIPYMSDIFTKVAGALALLGISPSRPSIIWNAVPFTFLIDWFFDVGNLMDDLLGKDIIPADVTILDFCISQKASTELTISRSIHDEDYRISGHLLPCAKITGKQYQRERIVPTIGLSYDLRDPSIRKLAIANSLLWAVMGRRKR